MSIPDFLAKYGGFQTPEVSSVRGTKPIGAVQAVGQYFPFMNREETLQFLLKQIQKYIDAEPSDTSSTVTNLLGE